MDRFKGSKKDKHSTQSATDMYKKMDNWLDSGLTQR